MTQTRQPAGIRIGGQFAAGVQARAAISLDPAEAGRATPEALAAELLTRADTAQGDARDAYRDAAMLVLSGRVDTGRASADVASDLAVPTAAQINGSIAAEPLPHEAPLSWADPTLGPVYSIEHPDVQAGKVVDTLDIDGITYHRHRDGIDFTQPYSMLIQSERPISDEEMDRMTQLAGYCYRSTVHGESLDDPHRVSPYAFTIFADTTKGRGYIGDFIDEYPTMLDEGSPLRTTDRAGAGTKGTRLVEPMDDAPQIEMYFDRAMKDGQNLPSGRRRS